MKLVKYAALVSLLALSLPSFALVILQYHHISTSTPPSTSTSPEDFRTHLSLIEQQGMQVVDLKTALNKLEKGEAVPDNALAITFDDAYISIYQNAWPLLKDKGWPFTIFVNPNVVDAGGNATISWEQLLEMQKNGAAIANHSQSHDYLIEKVTEENSHAYLDKEINGAEARIKEKLGVSHKLFAYPYGEFNLPIMAWLKTQGYKALGQHSGAVGTSTSMQLIPRYPAGGIYANPNTLKAKLHTLAFALSAENIIEPTLGQSNPPPLTLNIPLVDFKVQQIQCYSGAENAIPSKAELMGENVVLETQARKAIMTGRERYNCTAPSLSKPGWYYWYSQYWINPKVKNR
ncbi:MAG: hypothetical protein RL217_926 [Pseudomonadota bacterium]